MAGKGGATPATYSPSPTADRKKPPFFKEDWVRPDGRGFHQCRPACKFHLLPNRTILSLISPCNDNLNMCFSILLLLLCILLSNGGYFLFSSGNC